MKRATGLILALVVLIGMTACGKKEVTWEDFEEKSTTETVNESETESVTSSAVLTDTGTSSENELVYLPVRIIDAADYSEEGAQKLGKLPGYQEEAYTSFEYDGEGRLISYKTSESEITFQYLENVGLPMKYRNNEGSVSFTDPRWSQDRSEILLDVSYAGVYPYNMADYSEGMILHGDYKLSDIQLDNDGRLASASVMWTSNLGEEIYEYYGYSFDGKGNLIFVPRLDDEAGYYDDFVYRYSDDGKITGYEHYWKDGSGETFTGNKVYADISSGSVSVEAMLEKSEYSFFTDGRYRCERTGDYGTDWTEIALDGESGNLLQRRWYMAVSGITYVEKIEYMTMLASEYFATAVDYTALYPMFDEDGISEGCIRAAGSLQIPLSARLIFDIY